MLQLQEIGRDNKLINAIDWKMTPEEAVTLYLEWGNNWSHGRMIKSREDESHYFVLNTWESPPVVFFIRRDMDEAEELARIELPEELAMSVTAYFKGNRDVWGLTPEVEAWLRSEMGLEGETTH